MVNLSVINDFIQVVAQAAADALEIETSVVDVNLVRIAGTVRGKVPQVISGGVIKTVLESGQYHLTHDTKSDPRCLTCSMVERCGETAFVHCPIFFKGRVIGVMGLMCMDDEQRQHLAAKSKAILSFVQHMGDIISLKLEEYENQQKEKKLYRQIEAHSVMLDHILNSISDGYLIVDDQDNITRANQPAKDILGISSNNNRSELLSQFLKDLDQNRLEGRFVFYDEILIGQKYYGVTVNAIFSDNAAVGKVLNFKTLDKIGTKAIRKVGMPVTLQTILGESPGIIRLKDLIMKSAENNLTVLLTGESGTGKELIARAVHNMSRRRENPFVALNCAAIPENLLESELFGFEQGAFTGAIKGGKPGKFELAHRGTLFLDEIGDMPLSLQAKLLRVLQDFVIERIGSTKQRQVDIRIIAATNQNLDVMLKDGTFRPDLFYRLNVIPITIPPLRERGEDIVLLTEQFLAKCSRSAGVSPKRLTPEALDLLRLYPWPGNVRELENLIQYLAFICTDEIIGISSLPSKFLSPKKEVPMDKGPEAEFSISNPDRLELDHLEKEVILRAVTMFGNTTKGKLKAAQALGIGKTTLYRKLAEFKNN
ncbi:MAG: sigma 54-interacting transcriptional regulator [Treponema sp.]|jgi:transcriptional regulator with PAS, ATPase and Fis domain|nr:sigma 54-interacting transcriptional regulator [Treponema sp.]